MVRSGELLKKINLKERLFKAVLVPVSPNGSQEVCGSEQGIRQSNYYQVENKKTRSGIYLIQDIPPSQIEALAQEGVTKIQQIRQQASVPLPEVLTLRWNIGRKRLFVRAGEDTPLVSIAASVEGSRVRVLKGTRLEHARSEHKDAKITVFALTEKAYARDGGTVRVKTHVPHAEAGWGGHVHAGSSDDVIIHRDGQGTFETNIGFLHAEGEAGMPARVHVGGRIEFLNAGETDIYVHGRIGPTDIVGGNVTLYAKKEIGPVHNPQNFKNVSIEPFVIPPFLPM